MSTPRFKGKVAVVTGGNSGLGLATATAFAREGAQVVITGRDEKTLKAAATAIGEGTLAIRCDVSKVSDIALAMEQIGKHVGHIDALFANAGLGRFTPMDAVTEELFDETLAVNVKGLYFTVQKAIPLFAPGAAVVLNGSINAHKAMPGSTVYAASKAAVVSLAKNMSVDLLSKKVRVNVISPGPIESNLLSRSGLSKEEEQKTKSWIESQVPLKRFGHGEEIAAAVLYLCSEESAFVIGSELVIDGGMETLS